MENRKIRGFILTIVGLYGHKSKDLLDVDTYSPIARIYANDILLFSDKECEKRIYMVKRLKQSGHKSYIFFEDALAKATSELHFLQHDYREKYFSMKNNYFLLKYIKLKFEESDSNSIEALKVRKELTCIINSFDNFSKKSSFIMQKFIINNIKFNNIERIVYDEIKSKSRKNNNFK